MQQSHIKILINSHQPKAPFSRALALILTLALPFFMSAPPLWAELNLGSTVPAPLPEKLTIRSASSIALERNPLIREAREKIEDSQAQIQLAHAALYPTVSATVNGSYKKDATNTSAFRFGGEPYNQYSMGLKVAQSVGLGTSSALEIPKKIRSLTELDAETASRELVGKVITAFYKVILDQKILEVLLQTESIERESLATAQQRFKIGRGQKLDVLQVKTQLALISPKIAQARNQIQIDASALANLLAAPGTQEIRLQGNLIAIPYHQVLAKLSNLRARFPELEKISTSQNQLNLQRKVAAANHLPSLSASFDWSRSSFTKNELLDGSATTWTLGLQLNIPIFSGLSSLQERRSFASKALQLEFEEENLRNNLSVQQTQSSKNLFLGWETILSASEAFNLADNSLKEAKRNYQFSTTDFLQYLSVQQDYLQARSSLFQAEYNYITSLVNHFIASGLPLGELIHLLEEKAT